MSSKWSWLALGAGAYLAFLLSSFPAATAYRWFAPQALQLVGIQGTVWSGRAEVGSAAGIGLEDVRWSIEALPLLIGRLSGRLDARLPDGFVGTDFAAGMRRVRLAELRASVALPTLRALLPVQGMEGVANVSLASLQIEDGWPTSAARRAQARTAAGRAAHADGSARADRARRLRRAVSRKVRRTVIAAELKDTGAGPLEVSGSLRLDRERRYALGRADQATAQERPTALVEGLNLMAEEPDAAGTSSAHADGQPLVLAAATAGQLRKARSSGKYNARLISRESMAADRGGVALELRFVALDLGRKKRVDVAAFVLPGLVVDDPTHVPFHERPIELDVRQPAHERNAKRSSERASGMVRQRPSVPPNRRTHS